MNVNDNMSGGDARNGMARLGTIPNTLFTRPPNNFNKTGDSGRPTQLVANFVTIEQCPELVVWQYHVDFKPDIDSKNFRHAILKQKSIQDEIGNAFIFDGMILYIVSSINYEVSHCQKIHRQTLSSKIRIKFLLILCDSYSNKLFNTNGL
ncbi:unnamed protein product [Haemonchus placei]|uniref:DDE_Tnp_1_7 domain-containing protein n=1 Tax=Haemonchus placei TaxID=6290 RepID=A0A158QLI2_HAEPC|nr:unnamed protein product [Haemonchus placei]